MNEVTFCMVVFDDVRSMDITSIWTRVVCLEAILQRRCGV